MPVAIQKMVKLFPVFLLVIILFCSCSGNSNNPALLSALNESIIHSNKIITNETEDILHSLEEKLNDFVTAEKTGYWYPKAILVRFLMK